MKPIELERIWMTAIRGEGYYWREIKKRAERAIKTPISSRENVRVFSLI